jgi:hypothetical protein
MQSDNTFVVLNNYSIVVAHFYFSSTLEKALLRLIKSKALPRTVLSWIFQRNQSTHTDLTCEAGVQSMVDSQISCSSSSSGKG